MCVCRYRELEEKLDYLQKSSAQRDRTEALLKQKDKDCAQVRTMNSCDFYSRDHNPNFSNLPTTEVTDGGAVMSSLKVSTGALIP